MIIVKRLLYCTAMAVLFFGGGCGGGGGSRSTQINAGIPTAEGAISILTSEETVGAESLAAKEVRRYVYARTGHLLPIVRDDSIRGLDTDSIVVGSRGAAVIDALLEEKDELVSTVGQLHAEQYIIKTIGHEEKKIVLIVGGDSIGTLYGAYRFAEILGVRFYLHGDTVPDEQIALELPDVDETGKPLFDVRGIQPFHDFPEGPDWWNEDDYKAIIGQLAKLRMNFIGLHTYPEGGVGPEPTVWIGAAADVAEDGSVTFSSKSSYQNTLRGNWGYGAKETSEYVCGADILFERGDYGPESMYGMMPWPETLEEKNAVFNNVGALLKESFEYAHSLGIKTCVGTETPLIIPKEVKGRLKELGKDASDQSVVREVYEGMFERIGKAYPLDYYWFWTPEDWTWRNPEQSRVDATLADFRAALRAYENVQPGFTLATCGWVLGPPNDRALFDKFLPKEMPISCINRNVGFSFVEPGFSRAKGRPKWAIPWMEDDPALIIPQLWVGRMRRDAADALAYGCTGLLGIHWRTRILGPNVSALAKAAWRQDGWNPEPDRRVEVPDPELTEGRLGGAAAEFPNNEIADTENDSLYQTVVYNLRAYQITVPEGGTYTVTLKFCEPHYNEKGKRVFGVKLQGKSVIDRLDVFEVVGKNRALDYTFEGIESKDGMLKIEFVNITEYPFIAAFQIAGKDFVKKVNCGGKAYKDYEADLAGEEADTRPRDLPADDFYADWALAQFGPEVAEAAAAIFTKVDGGAATNMQGKTNLPRPSTWVGGPGGINPDKRAWEDVRGDYAFVDEFESLRSRVRGAGNLARFDYWLNNFRYLRGIGELNCIWARFNEAIEKVKKEEDSAAKKRLARQTALPIRKELVEQFETVQRHLMATVNTTGAMGNIMNWQQHLMPGLLTKPGDELAAALGEELPAEAQPGGEYNGEMRLIVPTIRGSLRPEEEFRLKVIVLGGGEIVDGAVYFRHLGEVEFARAAFEHVGRGVYFATIDGAQIGGLDFEYYVKAKLWDGRESVFPATAPKLNKTVVIMN